MTGAEQRRESPNARILLLAGQAFALGLTMAWIVIPASAIFLVAYGSEVLPVTYIGAAVAGVVSSIALTAALRRRPLATVAVRVLAGMAVVLLASSILLRSPDADWVSFGLLVLVPIVVPIGFVFVVGQAGMLLDVRALKALYARVVAGFALGFTAGGLAGPALLAAFGETEALLAAAAAAAAAFLVLVVATRRKYPAELSVVEHADVDVEHPTLRALAKNRYIVLIVAFQMLSAVESQWLDFLVFDHAARRYSDSGELAEFVSRFSAIAYGTDIIFLLVLAGLLLRRFGLRYGLTVNAIGVLTLLSAILVAASIRGSAATIVFVLIVGARVTDLTLADGAARTSLSAAYQAVPTRLRAVTQATVEGLGVPLAIGVSGVVLLALEAVGGADGMILPVLTVVVVVVWIAVAVLVYREYGVSLLANFRGRTLDAADLTVESEGSLIAVNRLVESADERDVRLGLDILTIARHPDLPVRLERLVVDERVNVRTDALERLVALAPHMAGAAARDGLFDQSPQVRAASVRVLGAAGSRSDLARIAECTSDAAAEVKVAVAFAVSRMGDGAVLAQLASEIARLAGSDVGADRTVAALMLGDCEPGSGIDRTALARLLADPDHDVVDAALAAFHWPEDANLLAVLVARLDGSWSAAAAVDALVRVGEPALAIVDEGLRSGTRRRTQELLVRVGREIAGPASVALLRRHVEHTDREVGLAVMHALGALGRSGTGPDDAVSDSDDSALDLAETVVVETDLDHATNVLRALVMFDDEPSATLLCAALRDELDLVRQRVLAALAMRHGTTGLNRVVFQFAQRDERSHALALEWLDITLTGTERAVVAILEPRMSDRARLNALMRRFPLPPRNRHEILLELVRDGDGRWRRPWISACALYTASRMTDVDFDGIVDAAARGSAAVDPHDEERVVLETLAGIRARRCDLV